MAKETAGLSLAALLQPELLADRPTFTAACGRVAGALGSGARFVSHQPLRRCPLGAARSRAFSSERVMANLAPAAGLHEAVSVYKSVARQIMYVDPPAHARLRGLCRQPFRPWQCTSGSRASNESRTAPR